MTDPERAAFEQAAYQHYLERHRAGLVADSGAPACEPAALFWRQADGTYGVLMFNAAWWGWQAAREHLQVVCAPGGVRH